MNEAKTETACDCCGKLKEREELHIVEPDILVCEECGTPKN